MSLSEQFQNSIKKIVGRGKIYKIKINSFSFYNYFVFYKILYKLFLSGINEHTDKATGNVCSHGDANDLTIYRSV